MSTLETASQSESLRRVAIDPVSRVEGHGKVTLLLDEHDVVRQARLHIVEFRGFEKFIQGRPYWEVPVLVQRLCGICPVSHHLAAAKAVDGLVGVDRLTPAAEKLRRLMHWGQVLQSHALHFFHLASPDLLFGFESETARRNIVGVIAAAPDVAIKGVGLRKFGQEVIRAVSGKRVHGAAAVPGGMNKHLNHADHALLRAEIDQVLVWARDTVALARQLYETGLDAHRRFATIASPLMGLVSADGTLDLYDGALRARHADGSMLFDQWPSARYAEAIHEEVKSWTYMKFPFFTALGPEHGWFRVGPLARLNVCDRLATPEAERERQQWLAAEGFPAHAALGYHWARMIELLHCAEEIARILHDPDLLGGDLVCSGEKRQEAVGVIEAPRGTLIHHYRIDERDQIVDANLIVSTTCNNQAMNESIRVVAARELSGRQLTPELLNRIEVAIRAYDPCLSCATHAVGRMPLEIVLEGSDGQAIDRLLRDSDGQLTG